MVADLVVQLFATVVILGMLGLVLLMFLNRKQDEEFERSYEDPASFRKAMRVHLSNQLGRVEKNIGTTVQNVVDTVRKIQPRNTAPLVLNHVSPIKSRQRPGAVKQRVNRSKTR